MTETYLAMVKFKLGIRGIIQESKRLHKIEAIFRFLEMLLSKARPPHLMEVFNLDELPFEEMTLTKNEMLTILSKSNILPKGD